MNTIFIDNLETNEPTTDLIDRSFVNAFIHKTRASKNTYEILFTKE